MPEICKIAVIQKQLMDHLVGKKVMKAQDASPRMAGMRTHTLFADARGKDYGIYQASDFDMFLNGAVVEHIGRYGKYLFFLFSDGRWFSLHMGLSGSIELALDGNFDVSPDLRFAMWFDDGLVFLFHDYYAYGKIYFSYDTAFSPPDFIEGKKLGVDAFSKDLNVDALFDSFLSSRRGLRTFLMDQKVICGIGNAYACEICYEAGIHPQSIGKKIPKKLKSRLITAFYSVLHRSYGYILGQYDDRKEVCEGFYRIYGKQNIKCSCGHPISVISVSGRDVYVCEHCQVLYK